MLKRASAICSRLVSQALFAVLFLNEDATCGVVFQPSFLVASGPSASAFLVGNVSDVSLTISDVSPSNTNTTGGLPPPSCSPPTSVQWTLSQEHLGRTGLLVRISLNRSLQLCANETDCCVRPLCVRQTVRVSACRGNNLLALLTVQAEIYALLPPAGHVSGNKTVIPNQVFQPLGHCPCDLLPGDCDIRCCCDQDCTSELLWLFAGQCLPGPFGGRVTSAPDYGCSAQSAENAPDWFPFLCVTSPSENNPFLGLFYQGKTVSPEPAPSFQTTQIISRVPPTSYRQGEPIFMADGQFLTVPQTSVLGQCVEAPLAFLQDFEAVCVRVLRQCPVPAAELGVTVRDGRGGQVIVSVVDEVITDLSSFLSNPAKLEPEWAQAAEGRLCVGVVLALSYTLYWRDRGLSAITVTRFTGNVTLNPEVSLTTRYSAVFVNGNASVQPNSGNPGYQVGRPVIGGLLDSATGDIKRAPISLWRAVGDGWCSSAGLTPVLYGWNSTSGCLLPVSLRNLTECRQLRETVRATLAALVPATLVSRTGKPDISTLANWTRVTVLVQNSSRPAGVASGVCSGVPTHLHIHVRSVVMGTVQGVQNVIEQVELSFKETTWSMQCDSANSNPCVTPDLTQSFSVTSSVTFTEAPRSPEAPKTRFRINFTEFDCDRNDVCWPELVFPLTAYYTGEPHPHALAKGLILVFFFIAASVLGTPWRRIRQAWRSS
ncbi:tectonic-2 isoform X2 [Brachyhypopomus gauderio]|uniref:tectonic-2 isoform X2 n=1 Tax=Brachyhypopomus gauderio TaxID=698409 RepID=UPI004041B560